MFAVKWKRIKGFSKYAICNTGEVISFQRDPAFIMKPGAATGGYLFCNIVGDDGKSKNQYLHRLVATYFIDPRPRPMGCGREVDHIDGDITNNRVDNLRIVSRSENLLNRKRISSCYPGVHWNKQNKSWRVNKAFDHVQYFIGYFKDELEAARAYEEVDLAWVKARKRKGYIQKNRR